MRRKAYYSMRTRGPNDEPLQMGLHDVIRAIISVYSQFNTQHYFQEGLGYHCIDEGHVGGRVGEDVNAYLLRKLGKAELWPPRIKVAYSEDDLFDLIEFMYDCVGKPIEGGYHPYYNCGYHASKFSKEVGQEEFRREVNDILYQYSTGFELSKNGEILALAESGFESLVEEEFPEYDSENVEGRVKAAVKKFRYRRASLEQRREAVRGLIDVLEYLRPQIKDKFTSTDESDLFHIANKFGLRHHNLEQKSNYDPEIWLQWMFYVYLSTIHAVLRMIDRGEQGA